MLAFLWVLAFIGIMIYVTLNSSSMKYFNAGFSTTICPEFYLLNILVDLYGLCNADRTLKICAVTIITRVREIRLRKKFAMSCVFVNILYTLFINSTARFPSHLFCLLVYFELCKNGVILKSRQHRLDIFTL